MSIYEYKNECKEKNISIDPAFYFVQYFTLIRCQMKKKIDEMMRQLKTCFYHLDQINLKFEVL